MADRSLAIRLSLKDAEQVRAGLERLGKDGETSLRKINTELARVTTAPTAGLVAANDVGRELSGRMAGLSQSAGLAGTALRSLGPIGIAVGAAFGAVSLGVGKAIQAAEEYGRVAARNEAVLRSTGYAAGLTAQQMGDLAQEIQETTMASDELALEAAAALQTFGAVSGDQFRTTLKLAQDLAVVMGGDMRSAATVLGKALADPENGMTMLRRAGILFTASQRDSIKAMADAGDQAGATGAILAAVAAKVGGAGAGERRGVTGATKGLTDAWADLLKEIGRTPAIIDPIIYSLGLLERGVKGAQGETDDALYKRLRAQAAGNDNATPSGAVANAYAQAYGFTSADAARRESALKGLAALEEKFEKQRRAQQHATAMAAMAVDDRKKESLADQDKAMDAVLVKLREEVRLAGIAADKREVIAARAKAEAEIIKAAGYREGTSINDVRPDVRAKAEDAGKIAAEAKATEQATRAKTEASKEARKAYLDELVAYGELIEKDRERRRDSTVGTQLENERARSTIETTKALAELVKGLELETAQAGMSDRQRAIAIELIKAEALARKDLNRGVMESERTLSDAERLDVTLGAGAKFDAEQVKKAAEAAAQEVKRVWERTSDAIVDEGADMIDRLFDPAHQNIEDIGTNLVGTIRKASAQLLSENLFRGIAQQAASMLGSLGGSSTAGSPAGDGGGLMSGLMGMLGSSAAGGFNPVSVGMAGAGLALSFLPKLFGGGKDNAKQQQQAQQAAQITQASWDSLARASEEAGRVAADQARAVADMARAARRSLAELSGDTAGSFQLLLEDNAERLEAARKINGAIALTEAQNAEIRRDWMRRLSDAQFEAVRASATALELLDRQVQSLRSSANKELTAQIGEAGQQAAAMASAAANYRNLGRALAAAALDLRGGDLSTLSPAEKLEQQRAEFARLKGLAGAGDQDALAQLPQAGRVFLEASRAFNATTTAYATDFAEVQSALEAAAASAGTQASAAEVQAALLDINERVLQAIEETLGQDQINAATLQAQLTTLQAIDATLAGTKRITQTSASVASTAAAVASGLPSDLNELQAEAARQTAIQDILSGLSSADLATAQAVLNQVAQQTSLSGKSVGTLTELVQAVRSQQEAEAAARAAAARAAAEEAARNAALGAQKQAAVNNQRGAQRNEVLPSNVGQGGISISSTGSGAGGRFVGAFTNAGTAQQGVEQAIASLNFLLSAFNTTISPSFSTLQFVNTTVNPAAIFNALLAQIGFSGFSGGGVMTAAGPLQLNRYASGGIADRPQLALFGEGRGAEAYVPLPDGRRIPVDLRGGGGANDNGQLIGALYRHGDAIIEVLERRFAALADAVDDLGARLLQTARIGRAGGARGGRDGRLGRRGPVIEGPGFLPATG